MHHRQNSTYHSLCYTSCGALAAIFNNNKGFIGNTDIKNSASLTGIDIALIACIIMLLTLLVSDCSLISDMFHNVTMVIIHLGRKHDQVTHHKLPE